MMLPPFKAIGNALVEIFGPSPGIAKWDEAFWDQSTWATLSWQNVTPQSMVVKLGWGADDPAGVLTVPAAGSWEVNTFDPDRKLDPSNGASPLSSALRPGRPMRISIRQSGMADEIVRVGLIDEIEYNIGEKTGSLRGTDIVPLIVQAKVPAGYDLNTLPRTLRARARAILALVGLDKLVQVEPDVEVKEWVGNPSFEQLDDPTSPYPNPIAWYYWPSQGGNHAALTPDAPDGQRVLQLYQNDFESRVVVQTLTDLIPGETYTLEAWARQVAGNTFGYVRALDNNNGYAFIGELIWWPAVDLDLPSRPVPSISEPNALPAPRAVFTKQSTTFIAPAGPCDIQVLQSPPQTNAQDNRMWRGGAEEYDDAYTTTPEGWRINSGTGTMGTSSGQHWTGTKAYIVRGEPSVSFTNDPAKGYMPVVGGALYQFSAFRLRESWADSSSATYINFFDAAGAYLGYEPGPAWEAGLPADTWTNRVTYHSMPPTTTHVAISINGNGGAEWFDEISIYGPIPGVAEGSGWHFDNVKVIGPTGVTLPDPPVGPLPADQAASAWSLISTSAFDALYAQWVDRFGTLRFRSFGNPQDNGFTIGGDAGLPLATLMPHASLANVYTAVRAFDETLPDNPVYTVNEEAAQLYGIITLTRDKPVPSAQVWVDSVRDDRAGAGLQYETGTLYPRTYAELLSILNLEMVDIVHIVADDIVPPLNIAARLLGVRLTADTDTGWTAQVLSYIPAKEWQEAEQPIPPEQPPPGQGTPGVVRYYDATKDTRAGRDAHGTALGSGTEGELPVGAWQGWRNRSFIGFASIPFGDVISVDKAELELDTSSQVNIGFGSSPKITVQRVTQSWSEGTASSPSGSNATKYPGPTCTTNDARTVTITRSENASVVIDITGIARAWFSGAAQQGVGLFSAGEDSTAYTTEFWSRENSTASKRPRLKLTVTTRALA